MSEPLGDIYCVLIVPVAQVDCQHSKFIKVYSACITYVIIALA